VGIVAITGGNMAGGFTVQPQSRGDDVSVGGVHRRIQEKVGLGKRAVCRVSHAGGSIPAEAGPIVHVLPAGGLDVHLAVAGRKSATGRIASAWARYAVILGIAAEPAEAADIYQAAVESRRGATVGALVYGAG